MFSEGQKRRASLNILEKLRSKGMPEKGSGDEEFDSMFAKVDEEGKIVPGEGEEGDQLPETAPPKGKRKPKLDEKKVDQFTKGLKSVF